MYNTIDMREANKMVAGLVRYLPKHLGGEALLFWSEEGRRFFEKQAKYYYMHGQVEIGAVTIGKIQTFKQMAYNLVPSTQAHMVDAVLMQIGPVKQGLSKELALLPGVGPERIKHLIGNSGVEFFAHSLSQLMDSPEHFLALDDFSHGYPVYTRNSVRAIRAWAKDWYPSVSYSRMGFNLDAKDFIY